jgi:hypothetical protein
MTINCNICNKEYASYSSRSNHIKKFHNYDVTKTVSNVTLSEVSVTENVSNVTTFKCKKCYKNYNSRQTRWRHEKTCLNKYNKDDKDIKIEKMEKEMLEYKKEVEKEMNKMKTMLQKSLKIHPKTLQKINNQLNNNATINNITIIQLGKENLSELLTKQEKLGILNRQAMGINDLVELTHASGKYKNCMNVYITNLQNTIGYMYDEKQNNFIAVNKNELLNDLVDSRMYDIEKFYGEFQEKIDPAKGQKIKKFIDRMNNEEDCLKGLKKEEIKLILYNNKEAISTILPKNKKFEEENSITV